VINPCLLLLSILFLNDTASSQKIIIKGQETKRKLTWPDFTGNPDPSSSLFAYTYYNLRYKYGNVRFIEDSAIIGGFEVILELDPQKSWAKADKVTDELLVHEQGHFNIGILCMREILSAFEETRFKKSDFNNKLQNMFTQSMNKYHNMTLQYDDETRHYQNKEQQLKWNQFFSDQLRR
jgi:hypothetical protein